MVTFLFEVAYRDEPVGLPGAPRVVAEEHGRRRDDRDEHGEAHVERVAGHTPHLSVVSPSDEGLDCRQGRKRDCLLLSSGH